MPLPVNWTTVRVFGTFLNSEGKAPRGYVIFQCTQTVIVDGELVVPGVLHAPIASDGTFEIDLPATNDPDLNAIGWGYLVTEYFVGGRDPYSIIVPYDGGDINLVTVAPAVPSDSPMTGLLRAVDIDVLVPGVAVTNDHEARIDVLESDADDYLGKILDADTVVDTNAYKLKLGTGTAGHAVPGVATGLEVNGPINELHLWDTTEVSPTKRKHTHFYMDGGYAEMYACDRDSAVGGYGYSFHGAVAVNNSNSGRAVIDLYGYQNNTASAELELDMSVTGLALWRLTGQWRWNGHTSARNDVVEFQPVNFLYTDAQGNMKSGALNHAATRTALGLGSVDNTADADKPVSTPQQAALDSKLDKTADVQAITKITQAAYDALTPPVATTLYVIVG